MALGFSKEDTLRGHRLKYLRKEIISGQSRWSIKQKLLNGEYDWWPESKDVDPKRIGEYIREAAETCMYETQVARDEAKSVHLERYLDLYRKCDAANDRSTARQILSDIAKLMGLNEKETLAIETTAYRVKLI